MNESNDVQERKKILEMKKKQKEEKKKIIDHFFFQVTFLLGFFSVKFEWEMCEKKCFFYPFSFSFKIVRGCMANFLGFRPNGAFLGILCFPAKNLQKNVSKRREASFCFFFFCLKIVDFIAFNFC